MLAVTVLQNTLFFHRYNREPVLPIDLKYNIVSHFDTISGEFDENMFGADTMRNVIRDKAIQQDYDRRHR